jgi:energy-coupling factor transporter transmembrane protein EcfT
MGVNPSTMPLVYLCPSSIMSMALDNASLLLILILLVWLLISVSNAVLYSIPGAVVLLFVGLWKSD